MESPTERTEASLVDTNNILVIFSQLDDESSIQHFFGSVIKAIDLPIATATFSQKTVYLCGDLSKARCLDIRGAKRIFVIKELSHNFDNFDNDDETKAWPLVNLGQIPISVFGLGVYYRRFFGPVVEHGGHRVAFGDLRPKPDKDYFNRICREHVFQSLTESTKPGKAHRTGIYLSPVTKTLAKEGEKLHFHLLRCSTNLSGPTENFRANDRHIVDALNQEARLIFRNQATLNHILAQVYHNTPSTPDQKQTKAKISAHADKTKDMPRNGIMAFCTFYDQLDKLRPMPNDAFDYGYKGTSGLTRLHFRRKESVVEPNDSTLPSQFVVTLYPDSVFFMPLSTNRLYTHEIQSSTLDAQQLPIRLGYVVRCSSTEAIHENGQTFLVREGNLVKLEPPTDEGMKELRKLYAEENRTQSFIDYRNKFSFSMNSGDYIAPQYNAADEFRTYELPMKGNLYDELFASVRFEQVGKGRVGTTLVKPDDISGIPIIRTTTRYNAPAQLFRPVHAWLAEQIQKSASLAAGLNNALIECYSNAYTTMGAHSDQALDLADDSFIALFSCYKHPEFANPPRKLIVESKESVGNTFEIPLFHNSVVVFSVGANRRFKHKIVLDTSTHPTENQWLGITFRTSKTIVQFRNEEPYFPDNTRLKLANDEEARAFYQLRHRENNETDFMYPRLMYTISTSDMMPPNP